MPQTFNYFPYNQFWRIKGEGSITNSCAGIVSIILFLLIFALFISQLVTVFQMQTMSATSQTLINSYPPVTTVSTYQQDEVYQPFMVGVDIYTNNPGVNMSTLNVTAYIETLNGSVSDPNRADANQTLQLQSCTTSHFSPDAATQNSYVLANAANWLCLPLNNNFTIQGSYTLNGLFTSLNFFFNCTGECLNSSNNQNLNVWVYTLSTLVNPTNGSNTFAYSIDQANVPIQVGVYQEYTYDLTQNVVNTDNSLFPWQSFSTAKSLQAGGYQRQQINTMKSQASTLLSYQRFTQTIQFQRQYLKILDALAYVGGIFTAVIAIFFFMAIYAKNVFEQMFAKDILRTTTPVDFGLTSFIKMSIYKILGVFNYKPKWPLVKKQMKLRQTVNNLLDVVYLQKRIQFLERAISVLLEKHQLKGLYLYHHLTKEKADRRFREHKLKQRLVYYLHQKKKGQRPSQQIVEERRNTIPESSKPIREEQPQQNLATIERQVMPPLQRDEVLRHFSSESFKSRSSKAFSDEEIKQRQTLSDGRFSGGIKSEENLIQSKTSIQVPEERKSKEYQMDQTNKPCKEDNQPEPFISQSINSKEQQDRRDIEQQQFKEAVKMIYDFDPEDLKEAQLMYQLDTDLKKLAEEAEAPDGDIRSKRVYESIDGWLKHELKSALRQSSRSSANYYEFELLMRQQP